MSVSIVAVGSQNAEIFTFPLSQFQSFGQVKSKILAKYKWEDLVFNCKGVEIGSEVLLKPYCSSGDTPQSAIYAVRADESRPEMLLSVSIKPGTVLDFTVSRFSLAMKHSQEVGLAHINSSGRMPESHHSMMAFRDTLISWNEDLKPVVEAPDTLSESTNLSAAIPTSDSYRSASNDRAPASPIWSPEEEQDILRLTKEVFEDPEKPLRVSTHAERLARHQKMFSQIRVLRNEDSLGKAEKVRKHKDEDEDEAEGEDDIIKPAAKRAAVSQPEATTVLPDASALTSTTTNVTPPPVSHLNPSATPSAAFSGTLSTLSAPPPRQRMGLAARETLPQAPVRLLVEATLSVIRNPSVTVPGFPDPTVLKHLWWDTGSSTTIAPFPKFYREALQMYKAGLLGAGDYELANVGEFKRTCSDACAERVPASLDDRSYMLSMYKIPAEIDLTPGHGVTLITTDTIVDSTACGDPREKLIGTDAMRASLWVYCGAEVDMNSAGFVALSRVMTLTPGQIHIIEVK